MLRCFRRLKLLLQRAGVKANSSCSERLVSLSLFALVRFITIRILHGDLIPIMCIYLSYVCLCAFVTIHYVMLCYTTLLYQHHMLESGITALPVICIVFIRPLTALSFLIFVFILSELYFYNIAFVLTLKASEFNHFAACDERNSSRSTHHVCV